MPAIKKCYHIKKGDFIRAGEASIQAKNVLKSLDLDTELIRRVAICGYEGEMNVVMHGGDGELCLAINSDRLILDITDSGPGIEDIERAMQKGFSTASDKHREMGFGAGMGLPNMNNNADHMEIKSKKGKGTQVQMIFSTTRGGNNVE
jgi:anti-sigma regulatory factor (Ser/Thr protein kinase)